MKAFQTSCPEDLKAAEVVAAKEQFEIASKARAEAPWDRRRNSKVDRAYDKAERDYRAAVALAVATRFMKENPFGASSMVLEDRTDYKNNREIRVRCRKEVNAEQVSFMFETWVHVNELSIAGYVNFFLLQSRDPRADADKLDAVEELMKEDAARAKKERATNAAISVVALEAGKAFLDYPEKDKLRDGPATEYSIENDGWRVEPYLRAKAEVRRDGTGMTFTGDVRFENISVEKAEKAMRMIEAMVLEFGGTIQNKYKR